MLSFLVRCAKLLQPRPASSRPKHIILPPSTPHRYAGASRCACMRCTSPPAAPNTSSCPHHRPHTGMPAHPGAHACGAQRLPAAPNTSSCPNRPHTGMPVHPGAHACSAHGPPAAPNTSVIMPPQRGGCALQLPTCTRGGLALHLPTCTRGGCALQLPTCTRGGCALQLPTCTRGGVSAGITLNGLDIERAEEESSAECWNGIQGQMDIGFTLFTWAKWNNGYRGSHFLLWPKLDLLQHRLHWIMHNSASLCHRTRCYTTMPGSAAARDVTRLCLALPLHEMLHDYAWLCSCTRCYTTMPGSAAALRVTQPYSPFYSCPHLLAVFSNYRFILLAAGRGVQQVSVLRSSKRELR